MADALDLAIAGGPPQVDFSPFTKLLGSYMEGRKARRDSDVMDAFKELPTTPNGSPDFNAMSTKLLSLGDIAGGVNLATLASGQRKEALGAAASQSFADALRSAFGGGSPAPAASGAPAGDTSQPRGLRNNNPGNIEDGPFAKAQPGYAGGDGRFARFSSLDHGMSASANLLAGYGSKGINTVQGVISRWAPEKDGNNVAAYADSVSKALGVKPDQPLNMNDPTIRTNLAQAMFKVENGRAVRATPEANGNVAPSGMTIAGTSADKLIPILSIAATHPNLPKEQQELARTLLTNALKGEGLTEQQKNYRLYSDQERAAGRSPKTAEQWAKDNESDKAFAKREGEDYGKAYSEIVAAGRNASGTLSTLKYMDKLVDNPAFYSGTGGEYATKIKRLLVSMGISDAKDAQPNELFVKLSNKLVLDASGGSFGTGFSNADRDFIQASTANIANTPEGNRSILQLATKVEQRKQVIAQRARDYAKRNGGRIDGGFDDELSAWAGQNPMFSEKELAAVAGAKPQGAPKLNPGTIVVQNGVRFQIQPDGSGKAMQ